MEIHFSFYEVTILVSTDKQNCFPILDEIREDFAFFSSQKSNAVPVISIELKPYAPSLNEQKGLFLFRNKVGTVYGWGSKRIIDYGKEALVFLSKTGPNRSLKIYCTDIEDFRELTFLSILSSVGEELDKIGMHRVHALGMRTKNSCGIIALPSGGGKSSMALLLKNRVKIFSDETPLVSKKGIYPFPVRMALRPEVAHSLNIEKSGRSFKRRRYPEKYLYSIPDADVAETARATFVIVAGSHGHDLPAIKPCSKIRAFYSLFVFLVVGLGVAQIAEQMIRADNFLTLVRIAFSRLTVAIRLTFESKTFTFQLSGDPRKNAEVLELFLNRR